MFTAIYTRYDADGETKKERWLDFHYVNDPNDSEEGISVNLWDDFREEDISLGHGGALIWLPISDIIQALEEKGYKIQRPPIREKPWEYFEEGGF